MNTRMLVIGMALAVAAVGAIAEPVLAEDPDSPCVTVDPITGQVTYDPNCVNNNNNTEPEP